MFQSRLTHLLIAAALLLPSSGHAAAAEAPPQLITSWGGLSNPQGIAVDGAGNVYVADTGNHRVVEYTSNGSFVGEWDQPSDLPSYLTGPIDVAVLPNGNVWVSEGGGFVALNSALILQRYWQVFGVNYLALDPTNHYLYTGAGLYVIKYSVSDGSIATQWQYAGPRFGTHFFGLAVGSSGVLYVSEEGFAEAWSPNGQLLSAWQPPEGSAYAIATDPAELLFVTLGTSVGKFTTTGTEVVAWTVPGAGGLLDIATDAQGSIFVLSASNGTVYKYGYSTVPVRRQTLGSLKMLYR